MELIDGALCFVNGGELDKAKALGAMRLAVGDDLHILDRSDTTEEFLKVALGGIKGEVADIDTWSGDLDALGLARLTGRKSLGTGGAALALTFRGGLFATADSDQGEQLREESLLLGWLAGGVVTAWTIFATVASGRALRSGGTAAAAVAGAVAIGGII